MAENHAVAFWQTVLTTSLVLWAVMITADIIREVKRMLYVIGVGRED